MITRSHDSRWRALPTVCAVVVTVCPSATSAFLIRASMTSLSSMTRMRCPCCAALGMGVFHLYLMFAHRAARLEDEPGVLPRSRKDLHSVSHTRQLGPHRIKAHTSPCQV